jgi:integrase
LFGASANRYWLRLAVRRICQVAKTPIIGPHGLRGTHATLAVQAGVTGDAVAAALGHESFAVTAGHYAKPEAVASARTHQIEENLDPRKFRGSSAPKRDAA